MTTNTIAYIAVLRAQIDKLNDKIYILEQQQGTKVSLPLEWHLSPIEMTIFSILIRRTIVSIDAAMIEVYSSRLKQPGVKVLNVFVCRMRKKLAPFGIEIKTMGSQGWMLTLENKERALQQISNNDVKNIISFRKEFVGDVDSSPSQQPQSLVTDLLFRETTMIPATAEAFSILEKLNNNKYGTQRWHCDDLANDKVVPPCVLDFLYITRSPVYEGSKVPPLFATYGGKRVRVVMASRFGDVGITEVLTAQHGYSKRLFLPELADFSNQP